VYEPLLLKKLMLKDTFKIVRPCIVTIPCE